MASESSTKQNEEATTEEVPGSIAIYTEKEINTAFNRDVTLSVLSLGHFISLSFAAKDVKVFSFSSKGFGNLKKDIKDKRLVNSVKYHN